MDAGARILLAVGLGVVLAAAAGCSKSRADVGLLDADGTEIAYQDVEAAHNVEVASLNRLYQERYDLIAEYRVELEGLVQENQKWFDAERSEIEVARQRSEQEYREKCAAFPYRQDEHRHQSLMKQDAITATYIPRVKEVNDRIDAQAQRVAVTRASLEEARSLR